MIYGDSLSLLSMASSYSGEISEFSLAHGRWRLGQPAHTAPPILCNMEHTQFVYVSEVDYGRHTVVQCDTFLLRDKGYIVSYHYIPSPNQQNKFGQPCDGMMIKLMM